MAKMGSLCVIRSVLETANSTCTYARAAIVYTYGTGPCERERTL